MDRLCDRTYIDDGLVGRVVFCSMPFDIVDSEIVFERVTRRSPKRPFAYVVTPNVDHVVRLQKSPELLSLYDEAWLTLCDSRIMGRLYRSTYGTLPVTPGSNLTDALLKRAIAPSDPITVIGADLDVVDRLKTQYGLRHVHHYMPPMRLNEKPYEIERCVDFIIDHPARFTFLAVGSPQQEKIAYGASTSGKATGVGLCIGCSLQFSVGVVPRAPGWVQKMGMEWLHRLMQEPGRLARRYLVEDMQIFSIFFKDVMRTNTLKEQARGSE